MNNAEGNVFRFQTLIATMLSSQVHDINANININILLMPSHAIYRIFPTIAMPTI